jgi:spermidine/putrescine transport system permease protein
VLAIPLTVWLAILVVLPLGYVFVYSLWRLQGTTIVHRFTIDNYRQVFTTSLYLKILLRTTENGVMVGIVAILLTYPLAYLIARSESRFKSQLALLVLLPLWVSYLMRVFAWQILLGRQGVINSALLSVGVIDRPLKTLLYGSFSVWIALLHVSLPFVFVPIYVSLERLPANILDAARDLGGGPVRRFLTVIAPLSLPGVVVGFAFAFLEAFGDYVTPTVLGGSQGILIGRVVVSEFGTAFNWPLGSALAFVVLATALVVVGIAFRLGYREAITE